MTKQDFLNNGEVFYQRQRFSNGWLPWVMVSSLLVPFGLSAGMYLQGKNGLEVWLGPAIAVTTVLMVMYGMWLDIEVSSHGIRYRFVPFIRWRTITWDQVERIQLVQFDPLGDYGGWGIKKGAAGWSYTVTGDTGLMITFHDGHKILLGVQDSQYWQGAIKSFYNMG